jgi:hypothetical protein
MTVAELLRKFSGLPADLPVHFFHRDTTIPLELHGSGDYIEMEFQDIEAWSDGVNITLSDWPTIGVGT